MKIFKNIAFCALLSSLPAAAQNTATQNGNWNDCATWAIYSRTTPLTLLSQGTGFSWATTTPSLVGLAVGDCFVEVTVYGNGSCSASSRRYFNLVTN